jgi:hypothetical protein
MVIKTYKSPIYRKLSGFWNIEIDKSWYLERDSDYVFLDAIIYVKEDTVLLPKLLNNKNITETTKEATGTWKIININPDSVIFNVPKHPYNGKYAVRFFIDKNSEFVYKNNIWKMELKNDSTYLICNKGSVMFDIDIRDWEGKN